MFLRVAKGIIKKKKEKKKFRFMLLCLVTCFERDFTSALLFFLFSFSVSSRFVNRGQCETKPFFLRRDDVALPKGKRRKQHIRNLHQRGLCLKRPNNAEQIKNKNDPLQKHALSTASSQLQLRRTYPFLHCKKIQICV